MVNDMKLIEIREIPSNELQKKVREMKQELFVLRFQQASGTTNDQTKKRGLKKDIARMLTVIREREIKKG
jgi:large subunit ribosomal protein L29